MDLKPLSLSLFKGKEFIHEKDHKTDKTFDKLSIMTYNTLFNKYMPERICSEERWKVQLREYAKIQPQILVLQEVRKNYLYILLQDEFIQSNYVFASTESWMFNNYTTITLFHKDICINKSNYYRFKEGEAKDTIAIVTEICLDGKNKFGVIGVHLRPYTFNESLRKTQLKELYSICSSEGWNDWVILGDFNFENFGENASIDKKISIDVWKELKKDETPTFDAEKNHLIYWQGIQRSEVKYRLDRVVMSRNPKGYIPKDIQLVLNKPFSETDPDVKVNNPEHFYPSDHFGYIVIIEKTEDK